MIHALNKTEFKPLCFSSIWCFSLRCLIKLLVLPPFPWQNVLHRLQLAPPCLLVKYAHTGERFDLLPTMFTLAIANTELARVENSHYHLNYLLRQLRCEFSFLIFNRYFYVELDIKINKNTLNTVLLNSKLLPHAELHLL